MTIGMVIMLPPIGPSPYEQFMGKVWQLAALDLVGQFQNRVGPVFIAAPEVSWIAPRYGIYPLPDAPDQPFHFGGRLAGIIEEHSLETVLYMGAGSAPLISGGVFRRLLQRAEAEAHDLSFANNLHSSDWLLINHAQTALPIIRAQERDNSLAYALQEAGYKVETPMRRPAHTLDLDTPSDAAIVALHHDKHYHLRRELEGKRVGHIPMEEVLAAFRREGSTLALIGRVSPIAWTAINKKFRVWTRVISEERGMVASGRADRGGVRSVLAEYWRRHGPAAVIEVVSSLADTVIFDSRPLWAAVGKAPSAADRYASDALDWEQISDPEIRAFTQAAAKASAPILLGGHTVVAGGLHALIEIAERRAKQKAKSQDKPKR